MGAAQTFKNGMQGNNNYTKTSKKRCFTTKLNTKYSSMDKKLQACWDNYAIDNDYAKLWRFGAHCTKI